MILSIYRFATYLAIPFLPYYLRSRLKQGKEDGQRMDERYGKNATKRPIAPLIWIHAASIGETNSAQRLIRHLLATDPSVHILITTTTLSAAIMIAQHPIDRVHHAYAPLDTPPSVARFLKHWQPHMVCFVDSELWPNMIRAISQRAIPLILLNGRMSPRSAARWRKAPRASAKILSHFDVIFAKSEADAQLFCDLGGTNVHYVGNMKYDAAPLSVDETRYDAMRSALGSRPCWVAASTHKGEDELLALAHQQVRLTHPDALLILVPRHAHRGSDIATMLRSDGWNVAQRSTQEALTPQTAIYLADTMGELGLWYRLAHIVFIGGSLVPHGGQNPIEAVRLGCTVLYGPHRFNFTDVCYELHKAKALIDVHNGDELAQQITHLIEHPHQCEALIEAGTNFLNTHDDVVIRIHAMLLPYLER
ncbi:MAG: 3-deoxy-D-manno-octulosonic acid transferase [Alphaproteobacteria bacterium]|nr:MAG: 3-deoxy-D-manno-octulosonic acid transferase [Alphaproteobacteria bacterium]